ncbi:MAG: hypothetical protein AB7U95_00430 [Reyranella sp.]
MFDDLIRELRRLDGQPVSVPIRADEEGYLDRECPSDACQSQFKVHEEDWREKVRDEEVFCPFCRHAAQSDKWFTQEQLQHAKEAAVAQVQRNISGAMRRDAQRWNLRQPRNSFLRITMQLNDRPTPVLLPLTAAASMRLKITCPACACRYAVIGAAFFCPACGHNAVEMMFLQALAAIRNALDVLAAVRAAIPDRDTAETTVRLIVENGLQNAVTTFQRYAEVLYARYPSQVQPRRNAFQSLAEGSNLWQAATGRRYSDYLDSDELAALTRYFQQRHLLAHTQGLVDVEYIARSGDTTYHVGQRLVLRECSVRECVALIEKLVSKMNRSLVGSADESRDDSATVDEVKRS